MSFKLDKKPNIIISGSPGTGKSSVCQKLMQKLDKNSFKWLEISEFCRQNHCIESHDKQLDSLIINEELLLTKLSPLLTNGGIIIDYHSVDLFPKQLIDVVFIMRCNNTKLYDRLLSRNYSEQKINNNIECEIFQVIVDEAIDWFGSDSVIQLNNETIDDLDLNCTLIDNWIKNFKSK